MFLTAINLDPFVPHCHKFKQDILDVKKLLNQRRKKVEDISASSIIQKFRHDNSQIGKKYKNSILTFFSRHNIQWSGAIEDRLIPQIAVLTAPHRTDPVNVNYSAQIAGQFRCLKSTGQVSLCALNTGQ